MEAIEKLAENQQKTGETQVIDIVLESGAANGFYQLGILFYLAALERKKIIKINRISGSSIGAIVGFYYFTNELESLIKDYTKLKQHFMFTFFWTNVPHQQQAYDSCASYLSQIL